MLATLAVIYFLSQHVQPARLQLCQCACIDEISIVVCLFEHVQRGETFRLRKPSFAAL